MVSGRSNMSPTIYLESYFEAYSSGREMDLIIEDIIKVYQGSNIEIDFHPDYLLDYNKAKERIVFKLVNKERNKELLKGVPFVEYLDLAIIFYYLVNDSNLGFASIVIRNEMLESWQVTVEELNIVARENTPKLMPAKIEKMEDIIKRILIDQEIGKRVQPLDDIEKNMIEDMAVEEMEFQMNGNTETKMYVVGNKCGVFGAACILYENLLKKFAERIQDNLYILPSSVHETIIIPAGFINDGMDLKYMVEDVNNTQVEPEEILSGMVYIYNSKLEKMTLMK